MKSTISKRKAALAGVEPRSTAWNAALLTIIPPMLAYSLRKYLYKSKFIT